MYIIVYCSTLSVVILTSIYIVVTKKNNFILFLVHENVCLDTKTVILSELEAEILVSVVVYS